MHIAINFNHQTLKYNAIVFDGPDGIDDAKFAGSSLGEVFEKILIFHAMNSLTYSDSPEEGLKSYFRSIEE